MTENPRVTFIDFPTDSLGTGMELVRGLIEADGADGHGVMRHDYTAYAYWTRDRNIMVRYYNK